MNNESKTVESRAKSQNGRIRLAFGAFAILLQIAIIVLMFTYLNNYDDWIRIVTRGIGIVVAIVLYSQQKTASLKMPWIMFILTFPVFGLAIYLLVGLNGGTKEMRRRYEEVDKELFPLLPVNYEEYKREKAVSRAASRISSYIRHEANYPVYQNTDVVYYDDAAKGLNAQLEALAKARRFIFMEYHAIEDKESWERIEDVLVDRVQAGVEVRVFYDDMGSIGFINTDFVTKLKARGIRCRVFNPVNVAVNMFLNNRDHRKITVIDGKVGFTGGYNLANEYFNVTHPYGQWKDSGIRLEGDAVRSLTVTFLEMWNAVSDTDENDVNYRKYLPHYKYVAKEDGFFQPYADSPMDNIHTGEDVYISMAEKAEEYCYFMTPYLILTDEMVHAFSLAARRGVDVRIITPGIPDKKIVYDVTRSFYRSLVQAGVRVFEWTPGFLHAKMSVADDIMATCGTINLDYRSFYHHFENGCFMVNTHAVNDIKADFDKTFGECREVTESYKERPNPFMHVWQIGLRLFAQLL